MICKNCKFGLCEKNLKWFCRRFPPAVSGEWPRTGETEYCGEHKPATPAQTALREGLVVAYDKERQAARPDPPKPEPAPVKPINSLIPGNLR